MSKKEIEDDPEEPDEPSSPPPEEKSTQMIDDANLAAKRMEDATAAQKIENDRAEAIRVETSLGGKAEAGVEKKEESDEDYAKKVMANDLKDAS